MEPLTRTSLRSPVATLACIGVLTLVAAAGLLRLSTDVGYRAFLGSDHPSVRAFDAFLERFGGGFPVAIVWSCAQTERCSSVFDPESLLMADQVVREMARAPGVRRVAGPANAMLLMPSPDGFEGRRLVEDGRVAPDIEVLAARARIDPLWVGSLISGDGQVGSIVVELSSSDSAASVSAFEALRAVLEPFEARGFEFNLVGGPVDFVVAGGELEAATRRLIPLVTLLLCVVIWLLVRSVPAVVVTLAPAGVAVLWTLGLQGWLGWPQNTLSQTLPPLVLVVSACHGIHVLWRYSAELAVGSAADLAARQAALRRTAADIGMPCIVTTLTTAGGFLSFATSGLESFVRFGAVSAAGIVFSWLLSFTLLPILLSIAVRSELSTLAGKERWGRTVQALVDFAEARPRSILLVATALGAIAAVGIPSLRVDVSFEDLYGEHSEVVRWVRFVEKNLRAPETLEIEIVLPAGQKLDAPEVVAEIEKLERFLPGLEGLGRVHSVLGPLRWMNRLLHDDDPSFERVGRTSRENGSALFMLTAGNASRLEPWLTLDHRAIRLSVEARKVPQEQLRALLAAVEEYLATEVPAQWRTQISGPARLVHTMVEEIKRTQLRSFATAALVVLALVALFMRSLGWALLAMIPTGLPVLLTLGAMGFAGVNLDAGTAMVAAVVIGIAIDDTVHLLTQYRRRIELGQEPGEAIRGAVPHVARALITTSVALALGFLSLLVSPWQSVANFGVLAAAAIMLALLADLIVLPALILAFARISRLQDGVV